MMEANTNTWRNCTLGDLVMEGNADLQTGPFGTMLNAREYTPHGVPVIAVQDIGENKLIHGNSVYISASSAESVGTFWLRKLSKLVI